MIEINEKFLEKDLKKHTDEELKDLLDFHYFLYEKIKQEMRRRLIIITK